MVIPLVSIPPATAAFFAIKHWPHRDPSAPRLTQSTLVDQIGRHKALRRMIRSRLDPTSETGLLLTASVGMVVVSASLFGAVFQMVRSNRGLASFDLRFSTWGAQHASAASTEGLKIISLLGGYPAVAVLSFAVAVLEFRRKLGHSVVGMLVMTVGGQVAVTNIIKFAVDRARPNILQLSGFAGTSFPSGHAAAAAASYAVFALMVGRRRSTTTKAFVGAAATGIAVAVAGTRGLLGVHWLTDVVAGLFLGWAWFTLISLAFGGRVMRFGDPFEKAERAVSPSIADV